MVVGDVGGDVGQRDGSGDLLATLRVVFIDVSSSWGPLRSWGLRHRFICYG